MKDNKKKTLVLAILGLALVAVGAFQFIPKGGGSASVATNSAKKSSSAQTSLSTTKSGSATPNGTGAAGVPTADSPNGELADKDADPQKALLQNMVKTPYPARDPFAPQGKTDDTSAGSTAVTAVPVQTNKAPVASSGFVHRPPAIEGGAKPWDPLPSGAQPGATATGNPNTSGPIALSKGAPLRQPTEFAYTLKGVIVGNKPMAVFEDDSGNQRLVPVGGSLDGDSKVIGIEKGKVRIRHRGKDQTHTLPEGP